MRKYLLLVGLLLFGFLTGAAQERTVSGKVTAQEDGSALPGVNVVVKGTTTGTVTDGEGNFRISVPSGDTFLVFSFIGLLTQEVPVGVRAVVDVVMSSDITQLNEVVVVGYGTQLKQDLTGNIASVKGDVLQNTPVPNFTQALQGRSAGVFVESQSGRVGGGIKVRVRGATSISGSNEPLYVVDGIPINTSSESGNALADINFNDVESVEILKDASASAIYGARAANGVVLLTTKRGKSGKTNFNLNLQYGFNSPTNDNRGFLNSAEYIEFYREAAVNSATYLWNRENAVALDYGYTSEQEVIDELNGFVEGRFARYSGWSDYTTLETNTNWEKQAFQQSPTTTNVDMTASGGTDKTKFYISGAMTDQNGILIGNNFQRLSTRINLEQKVSDRFNLGINMSVSRTVAGRVPDDNEFSTPMQLVALAPITPVRDLDGNLYDRPTTTYYNGLIDYEDATYKSTTIRNIGGLFGEFKVIDDLKFRSEISFDVLTQNDDEFYGSRTSFGQSTNGFGRSRWYRDFNYNTNNYLSYGKTFADTHVFDATLGMSFQKAENDRTSSEGQQFPTDDLKKLASAGSITGGTSSATQYSFLSYFARGNYKFNDKYLLSLSGRYDGSSRFGENNKWGFFPAVSAGWILSNEGFLSSIDAVSFLKLRGSYGLVGNAEIGNFNQYGLWGAVAYNLGSAIVPNTLANPDLNWEITKQTDIGIDFGFLNNRLTGEIDYYIKNTSDLLYFVPVPGTSGYTTQLRNIGEMQNSGYEIVLNSVNIDANSFKWSTSINLSSNKNKIVKLDGEQTVIPGNDGRYLNSLVIGEAIGVFYGPKYAGVDPDNGDALYYLADGENTTNDYNSAGDFVVGNPNPRFMYGITNDFSYKNFSLSVLMQGVQGIEIMNGAGGFMSANGDWFDNQTRDQLNRWQNPGDITDVPQARLNYFGYANGIAASSRYIYDGSYLRIKNVTLGYNLPQSVLQKLKLTSTRIYVTGQNLFTFTKYPGWDPEVNSDYRAGNRNQGADFYSAPQIKSIVFGLNVGF